MPKISKDHVENFGRPPLSPYMCGEQPTSTSAPIQGAAKAEEVATPNSDLTWNEPDITVPQRSMNTVVFQSKRGGNSVVVNDEGADGDGYILITHHSGSVVQIDQDGTILIKSFGDTYNTTEGLHYQRSAGDTNQSVGGEWNVMVEGGSGNVSINGDLNIECENFALTARGKATFNSGEGIEMKGAKFSMEAHTDNLDLIAKNVKIGASETFSVLSKGDMSLGTESNMNLKGNGEIRVDASGELKMKGSNARIRGDVVYIDDVVRLAEGGAGATGIDDAVAPVVSTLPSPPGRRLSTNSGVGVTKVRPKAGGISGREIDDV